jgi:predicted membrane protein (TIGR00267 family)
VAGVLRTSWKALLAQAFRRYFVNTVFDSTFVSMGIVVASALVPTATVVTVVGTLFAATLALGISTGTSVYEAEKVEAEIRLRELERAMLTDLDGTEATRVLDVSRYLVVTVNVVAPLAVFLATAGPFLLSGSLTIFGIPTAFFSVAIAMMVLFIVGTYLGRLTGRPAWLKGLRMAVIGLATFAAIWFIQGLLLG